MKLYSGLIGKRKISLLTWEDFRIGAKGVKRWRGGKVTGRRRGREVDGSKVGRVEE